MNDLSDRWNRGLRAFGTTAVVAAMALLGACASKEEKPDAVLQELVMMYPGHYDNTAQAQADIAHGIQPPHEALALDIVPVEAIMLGEKNVFYLQESVAGEPNRVLGQKVVIFGVVGKDIVQTDFSLNEPYRWRNGQNNPDLFKSIMTTDVRSNKGCSLRWKRKDDKFVANNDVKTCHARAGGVGMSQIQAKAELGPVEYSTSEQAFDRTGHLSQGRLDEPFYRFRKAAE